MQGIWKFGARSVTFALLCYVYIRIQRAQHFLMYVFYADFISFYYIGPTWVCSERTTFPCKSGSHYSNNSKWNEAKKWHTKNVIKYVLLNTICIFHWHSFAEYTLTHTSRSYILSKLRKRHSYWEFKWSFFRFDEHNIWLKHIFLRLNYFFSVVKITCRILVR